MAERQRVAVVTGASSGIGEQIARELASAGTFWGHYNASKLAVEGLMETLRHEVRPFGAFEAGVRGGFKLVGKDDGPR